MHRYVRVNEPRTRPKMTSSAAPGPRRPGLGERSFTRFPQRDDDEVTVDKCYPCAWTKVLPMFPIVHGLFESSMIPEMILAGAPSVGPRHEA